jgi:hypothetical protein
MLVYFNFSVWFISAGEVLPRRGFLTFISSIKQAKRVKYDLIENQFKGVIFDAKSYHHSTIQAQTKDNWKKKYF